MIQIKHLFKCQKAVRINKEFSKRNNLDPNYSANKTDTLIAAQELSGVSFKLYMYLISNQNNYTFGLSRQDVTAQLKISSKSYDNAITELQNKNYLTYNGEQATDGEIIAPLYEFYSRPNP